MVWPGCGPWQGKNRGQSPGAEARLRVTLGQVSNSLALNSTASTWRGLRASNPHRGPGGRCCLRLAAASYAPPLGHGLRAGTLLAAPAAQVDRFWR